jgi:hypothetical protein
MNREVGRQRKNLLCARTNEPGGWRTTEKSARKRECRSPPGLLLPFLYISWSENMNKSQALDIVCQCAAEYRLKLEGKNYLFIFGSAQGCSYFETAFPKQNFHHLTGINSPNLSALEFYFACLDHRLPAGQVLFSKDGTTPLKLDVLPALMRIYRTAKMVGDYDNSRTHLYTEKIAGGVMANLGFIRDKNYPGNGFYVPNTAIRDDIRLLTLKPVKRVLVTLSKDIASPRYDLLTYLAKGISIDNPAILEILSKKAENTKTLAASFQSG